MSEDFWAGVAATLLWLFSLRLAYCAGIDSVTKGKQERNQEAD